jgi:hypothetical protein
MAVIFMVTRILNGSDASEMTWGLRLVTWGERCSNRYAQRSSRSSATNVSILDFTSHLFSLFFFFFFALEAKNKQHIQQNIDIVALYCALAMVRLDVPCNNLTNPWKLSFPSVCLIQSLRTAWTGMEGPSPSSWNNNLWKLSKVKCLVASQNYYKSASVCQTVSENIDTCLGRLVLSQGPQGKFTSADYLAVKKSNFESY